MAYHTDLRLSYDVLRPVSAVAVVTTCAVPTSAPIRYYSSDTQPVNDKCGLDAPYEARAVTS